MAYNIHSLVSEAKRNRLSLITSLTEEDVMLVWEAAADFIERLMLQQKGVCISGLGTFTFCKKRIDVGSNKFILIQRPVFVLSEKFVQTHSLQYTKQHTTGQIPILPLNFTILSNGTGLSREMVEGAVKEVLQALSRSVAAKKIIELDFGHIGRLIIHDGKAKMCFFREFILRVDGGEDMELAFRLNTASSIMTNPNIPSRPSTSLSLPKIVEPLQTGDDLSLEYSRGSNSPTTLPSRPSTSASASIVPSRGSSRRSCSQQRGGMNLECMGTIEEEEEELDEMGEDEEVEGVRTIDRHGKMTPLPERATPFIDPAEGESRQGQSSASSRKLTPKPAMLFVRGSKDSSTPSVKSRRSSRHSQKSTRSRPATTSESLCTLPTVRPSTCSHESSAGQELCYLCHQRAARNIPVDITKEKADMEKWMDETMLQYRHRKDIQEMAKVQGMKTRRRLLHKDMASFNLDVAEKKRKEMALRSSEFKPSYVFPDRAITPALYLKQQRYCGDLDEQVERKHSHLSRERELEEKMGREEQERLAKELAVYEQLYREKKAESVADYQHALEEQVKIKEELVYSHSSRNISASPGPSVEHARPPSCQSRSLFLPKPNILVPFSCTKTVNILKNGNMRVARLKPLLATAGSTEHSHQQPVFGVHDLQGAERSERERARTLFLEQLAMVAEKQKRAKEKTLRDKLEEEDMLQRTRDGLASDLRRERHKKVCGRKALEQDWFHSMKDKQQFLLEELQRAKEQGILLHQQCEKYQRCRQCQRKRDNAGKSNLLHETRYISGSRLMV